MSDQVLWFAARGAGAVAQLFLTGAVAMGLVTVTRFQSAGWPRFFNYELHRRISLLSVVFLAVHILAAVLDPYTNLGIAAALVPFASTYRSAAVALGVVGLYLFIALVASSLLRKYVSQKAWRAIHWTSYGLWPVAILHGMLAGTDALAPWMLRIDAVCVAIAGLALAWRILPRGTIGGDTRTPGLAAR